jgi:hypothetical protein
VRFLLAEHQPAERDVMFKKGMFLLAVLLYRTFKLAALSL